MSAARAALRALDDGRARAEFYDMWRTMHAAGFAHPKAFETMGPRPSAPTEQARAWLLAGTALGDSITRLVTAGGARFEAFERSLLALGDESGQLEECLRLLADFYRRKHQLMRWVKKKMAYPFFTGLFACVIAPLQLLFFGHERLYVAIAGGGVAAIMLGAGSIIAATSARYGRTPALVRARMARALVTAIEAGLTLPRAVRLAAEASASPEVTAFVSRLSERQLADAALERTLAGCPHMAPEFAAVVATSERTGDFGGLKRLAELYEDGFR
ncbi:MAG TPA: type II secretion system F family protein [Gemmatimonadaceae bacterium]|nr:type II secretion system F family protein [Gemmatimonadaceae bacterium]